MTLTVTGTFNDGTEFQGSDTIKVLCPSHGGGKNGKSPRIFDKTTAKPAQLGLARARRKVALKLQNPRLSMITHHTFRHWKATMSYHETKDILYVQQLLGHKKIENTLIYVNLESALFHTENDNFHVKTATTPEEITQLLEVGFEYVCQKDGLIYLENENKGLWRRLRVYGYFNFAL